jgi:hypothetical protein
MVHGSGFRVQDARYRVQGSGFRVQSSGCMVQGSGFRVQGTGYRVQGAGCRVHRASPRIRPRADVPNSGKPGVAKRLLRTRWSSNPSRKCPYERPTWGTVFGTMRSMRGAGAGYLAMNHQSLCSALCEKNVSLLWISLSLPLSLSLSLSLSSLSLSRALSHASSRHSSRYPPEV